MADTLSRYPHDAETVANSGHKEFQVFEMRKLGQKESRKWKRELVEWQARDPAIVRLIEELGRRGDGHPIHNKFVMRENILFRRSPQGRWQVWIPPNMVEKVIWEYHIQVGHFGVKRTTAAIKDNCYFPKMRRQVRDKVRTCDICQRTKHVTHPLRGEAGSVRATERMEIVSVDIHGPLVTGRGGFRNILVILDVFSRYVKLYPIRRATARIVTSKVATQYCREIGRPKRVLTDNGRVFAGRTWCDKMRNEGIKISKVSLFRPAGNPVERANREINRLLRVYCQKKHTSWPMYVGTIESYINGTVSEATGVSPYELMWEKKPPCWIEKIISFPRQPPVNTARNVALALRTMERAQGRRQRKNGVRVPDTLKAGDWVLAKVISLSSKARKRMGKVASVFRGPYQITQRVGISAYELKDPDTDKIRGIFNIDRLRQYYR